jgi:hypothetical protein
MSAGELVFLGHRAVFGSDAARWLVRADRSHRDALLDREAGAPRACASSARRAGFRLSRATSSDGYLGLALPTPNPDDRSAK